MSDGSDRTLSKRFGLLLPFLTLPYFFVTVVFDIGAPLLFGIAYGVAIILLATAVGVFDARRNPAP
ncbi:hypothetical protein [Halorientalis sp.]|jgi:hypothetical protein|uniref:hypothetical protein n=1 Tax=Halorientalis sp. TaxID=1931229 RepID=UPI0026277DCE|nr:hypothetical protein [Halorientalis sp.]